MLKSYSIKFFILCFPIIMASCAMLLPSHDLSIIYTKSSDTDTPKRLKKRLVKYWQKRGVKDFSSSYDMESYHTRFQLPRDKYLIYFSKTLTVKSLEVLDVNIKGSLATISIKVKYDRKEAQQKGYPVEHGADHQFLYDYWVQIDNEWFHVIRDRLRNLY